MQMSPGRTAATCSFLVYLFVEFFLLPCSALIAMFNEMTSCGASGPYLILSITIWWYLPYRPSSCRPASVIAEPKLDIVDIIRTHKPLSLTRTRWKSGTTKRSSTEKDEWSEAVFRLCPSVAQKCCWRCSRIGLIYFLLWDYSKSHSAGFVFPLFRVFTDEFQRRRVKPAFAGIKNNGSSSNSAT